MPDASQGQSSRDRIQAIKDIISDLHGGSAHSSLSFLSLHDFPEIIQFALDVLEKDQGNEPAADVIAYASLQYPASLHPHLDSIFRLRPNSDAYYGEWPWRESGLLHFDFLREIIESGVRDKERASWALLETRHPTVLKYLLQNPTGFAVARTHNWLWYHVGYEPTGDSSFRQLYTDQPYHIVFRKRYLESARFYQTLDMEHPTWHIEMTNSDMPRLRYGGAASEACSVCGSVVQHFITLNPIPSEIGVTGLNALTLQACLRCMAAGFDPLFYKHHMPYGQPRRVEHGERTDREIDVPPLKETKVWLARAESRWKWQDWALSSSAENLHRVGGYPCWIVNSEYVTCPNCHHTMTFLMQIDSDLPPETHTNWFWGAGGLFYFLWCDECKVSGFIYQQT